MSRNTRSEGLIIQSTRIENGSSVRVLHILPSISSRSGGPVRSTLANCRALRAVDREVQLTLAATERNLKRGWREEFVRRMPRGMELQLFPAVGRHAFTFSVPLVTWLWANVHRYDLIVVRSLLNPISSSAARIAGHHDVPYLIVPHGTLSEYTFEHRRSWLKRVYFSLVERSTLRGAAAVRFTTDSERDQAPSWGRDTLTCVIPHPFEAGNSEVEQRNRDSRQVLFLSRFHPKKGLDVLLPAIRRLQDRVPDAKLVLAGAGTASYEARVRDEIRRLGLTGTVALPGFVEGEEKACLLASSSVFVLPSLEENFGVAVVEAMDAGLPVVISRGVGIWREVHEMEAGLVVDRDPQELADALAILLLEPERGRRMGANGRNLVRKHYAPSRIGQELFSLYRKATVEGCRCSKIQL